jgi:hypothetical protein
MPPSRVGIRVLAWLIVAALPPSRAFAAPPPQNGDEVTISRLRGKIVIDGNLDDDGWRSVTPITKWYETNPGDNLEPKIKNVGYLAYDDKYLYAAFEFDDPDPSSIRAPFGDRDNVAGFTDYGGVILDTRHDGRTGILMVANAHNIQYDSVLDDASGNEDPSPDFYWASAAKITSKGWVLEMRIPFSSLRYRHADPQTWGIMLYRNYPRDRHYQFFSARQPRGSNCFICHSNVLSGLTSLPPGGHLVVAPYVAASEVGQPRGEPGSPFVNEPAKPRAGFDVKWTPSADDALDATVNPDFSQIESDTAQIATNQRFALFFPEKRPFFLEGVELLNTPIQAVYTRTITDPDFGTRMTGKHGATAYTVLVAQDAGGGSVILPGSNGSDLAAQDFDSVVTVARVRHDLGSSFVGVLLTDREAGDNGYNRVIGPDVQFRPSARDVITAQWLYSATENPNRPDLSSQWTGQSLSSSAAVVRWQHNTTHYDAFTYYNDVGNDFRANTGFVPQVGYREGYFETGYTVFPSSGFFSRVRTFLITDDQADREGALIFRQVSPGAGMDGRWNSFLRFRYENDRVRSGSQTFPRQQFVYVTQVSPWRRFPHFGADGYVGQDVDFENSRPGRGGTLNLTATVNPTIHLELAAVDSHQWLHVDDAEGISRPLFTARVSRLRGTYTFTARLFIRVIGQYVSTDRDPSLYLSPVSEHSGTYAGSALFAYKLNWQSVMYVGYGDDRDLSEFNRLEKTDRSFFVKMSYAFQR